MSKKGHIRRPEKATEPEGNASPRNKKRKGGRKPTGKRKVSISTVILVLMLIIGLAIMAYPTFSDWWNSYHQSRAIASYVTAVEETDPKVLEAMIQAAHEYNDRLALNGGRFTMSDEELAEYNSLLNLAGNGIMGYITIPTIGVNLPIYHGVDESHLQVAIGHIEGSSLPVGGASTHTVVSGHRGLPSAKLFTDLDQLVEGDIFMFSVLNNTLTYEVDQIRIVEPSDMSSLNIEQGADYATLVTCTPYGINTHRLLVRGHRIENQSDRSIVPPDAVQIPNYIAVPATAIPIAFVYLLAALIFYRRNGSGINRQKALEAVREHVKSAKVEGTPADNASGPETSNGNDRPTNEEE